MSSNDEGEGNYSKLKRLDTNLHALEHREEDELLNRSHILGGEVFNSDEIISSSDGYPEFSTIDKSQIRKEINESESKLLFQRSESKSKIS
jgi:hypothetical protein